ncbi:MULTISPECIES: cell wall-binding repeat-containing protein [unclassified Rathayibacter]|uniref:cell wall-binding repeat-containing protein n=1 Tax=unclassified Rathayibacter TaxID=2609250 RepID=UPI00188D9E77|nr:MULTISPECIES: cell wall-binding repeat-containing protein [unclassified Rathayibacter]MBF4463439.1 cell wall-binding repeat-containing protein [Rathayibacter sp. VKM Ac-2879]MBF4504838.1 cell wall-binding repeat-containing protein [Rathayibacter sp. VKM Ac-2878]
MGNYRRSSRLLTAALIAAVGLGAGLVPVASAAADPAAPSTLSVETGALDPTLDRADQGAPGLSTQAYDGDETKSFRAGFIISDANFFDSDALSASQVQSLLNDKGSGCSTGVSVPCLKNFSQQTSSKPADAMCSAYAGASNESAATIFSRVGLACGINPLALVVLVQKERSLVTSTSPTATDYNKATGFNCPDTAPCDPGSAGFFTQVYSAARQFKKYANPPGSGANFTAYAPGTTPNIAYYPDTRCGSSPVTIGNQATADLYYYTPYQPNSYALTGTGDSSCATYGNVNFWYLFSDWNPAGTLANAGIAPDGSVDTPRISGTTLTASGWTVDPTSQQLALATTVTITAPDGSKTVRTQNAGGDRGDIPGAYPVAGRNHGFSVTAPVSAIGTYTVCASAASADWNRWVGTGDSRGPGSKDLGCSSVSYKGAIAVTRLAGIDRQETAVKVSQATFQPGVNVVYIASGQNFPDALSAAPAAAKQGGPLLLVDPDSMSQPVQDELSRLKPKKIVVVGSNLSVSDALYQQLATYVGSSNAILRLGGVDRYDTSKKIINYAFPGTSAKAWMTSGERFPDALGAGASAGSANAPVILVNGGAATADQQTIDLLTRLQVTKLTIAGSTLAVSDGIKNSLPSSVVSTRIGGVDRYDTSEQMNRAGFPSGAKTVYLTTGEAFPDGLSGGAAAGYTDSPLFTVQPTCVPQAVLNDISAWGVTKVNVLGGPTTLSDAVLNLTSCG